MGKVDPFVAWIAEEVQGIRKILRLIAPRYTLLGSDVLTLPPEVEAMAGAQAGGVQRAPNDPSARREWAGLPAIKPAVGAPPLVAPNRPFAASLAGGEPPAPILAPLSHGRGLEAPSGIALGVAKPVAMARASSTPPPVQRSPLRTRPASESQSPTLEQDPGAESAIAPAVVPRLAIASAAPSAPARSLVRPDAGATAAPPPGLVLPPRLAATPGLQLQRAPATPAAEQSAMASRRPTTPEMAPVPDPGGSPVTSPSRLNLGQARRLGLGAPIGGGPLGSSEGRPRPDAPAAMELRLVQRAPMPPPSPAPALEAVVTAAGPWGDAEPAGATAATSTSPLGRDAPDRAPRLATPLASAVTVKRAPSVASDPQSGARPAAAATSSPGPGARPPRGGSVPLTSARPLRAAFQRAPLTIPLPGPDVAVGASAAGSATGSGTDRPVKVHRDQAAGELSRSLDARSFTHGGEIFLPASHGPLTSGAGRALLAHELTHVTQQRRMGSSLPDEGSPHGRSMEAEAVAAERSGELPLAPGRAGHDHGDAAPAGKAGTPAAAAATGARPQRAGVPGVAPESEIAATGTTTIDFSAIQRAPREPDLPKPTSDASGRSYSEPELEDLARQLHGRLGRMLRRDLLVERERAGLAMDIR